MFEFLQEKGISSLKLGKGLKVSYRHACDMRCAICILHASDEPTKRDISE